mgnify:FL=1
MLEHNQLDDIFSNIKEVEDKGSEIVSDLAGYQVTRAELFSHAYEPSITIWPTQIRFNMACLRRLPGVTHIQILIHPEQRRLIIRPCLPDTPDSLRWAKSKGGKELSNRNMLCKIFAAKVFDLMKWDLDYRYKMLGRTAVYQEEILFLFKLTDFELFLGGKKRRSYLPGEWRDYFGTPAESHEEQYKIDLADGYITTGGV